MAVVIEWVDLTPQQVHTLGQLTPIRNRTIEQVRKIAPGRITTKTFVRVGTGKTKREWLLLRNGRAIENPTPGSGTPR
jgi:hypothetical protein